MFTVQFIRSAAAGAVLCALAAPAAHAQATGACCIGGFNPNAPICEILTRDQCSRVEAGSYRGDGTTCTPGLCTPGATGACCIGGFNPAAPICMVLTFAQCQNAEAGAYLGNGVVCTPTLCPRLGICCTGTTCHFQFSDTCTGPNTMFVDGSACNLGGDRRSPCCAADFNKDSSVGVQDIFDFLGAYFGNNAYADINGGGITVQDIFDFLSAYFAGC
jgi:hypothetical protein